MYQFMVRLRKIVEKIQIYPLFCACKKKDEPRSLRKELKKFMKKIECPCCGATLTIDENNEYGVCEFCESKIRLDDYRSTNVFVDEANVRKVENEKEIRMKELEMQQSQQEDARKHQKKMAYIGIGLLVAIFAYAVIRNIFFDDFFTIAVIFTMGMPVMVMGAFFFFVLPRRMGRIMSNVVENGISYPMGTVETFQRKNYRKVTDILK